MSPDYADFYFRVSNYLSVFDTLLGIITNSA
jgi:hypothetical protein